MLEIQEIFAKSIVLELQKCFIPKNKWQLTLQGGGMCPCAPPSATSCLEPDLYYIKVREDSFSSLPEVCISRIVQIDPKHSYCQSDFIIYELGRYTRLD